MTHNRRSEARDDGRAALRPSPPACREPCGDHSPDARRPVQLPPGKPVARANGTSPCRVEHRVARGRKRTRIAPDDDHHKTTTASVWWPHHTPRCSCRRGSRPSSSRLTLAGSPPVGTPRPSRRLSQSGRVTGLLHGDVRERLQHLAVVREGPCLHPSQRRLKIRSLGAGRGVPAEHHVRRAQRLAWARLPNPPTTRGTPLGRWPSRRREGTARNGVVVIPWSAQ